MTSYWICNGLCLIKTCIATKMKVWSVEYDAHEHIIYWVRNPLATAWRGMPYFRSQHHSEHFIIKYIDVRCHGFDSAVWCSTMIYFFLKAGTSKWAEILFYTSVLYRVKVKMAQHKLSNHIDGTALKYCVFEIATFQFRGLQLHSQTWKWIELLYSSCIHYIA